MGNNSQITTAVLQRVVLWVERVIDTVNDPVTRQANKDSETNIVNGQAENETIGIILKIILKLAIESKHEAYGANSKEYNQSTAH